MKILFFITGLGVGGAEKMLVTLADALSLRGFDVCIVYITGPLLIRPIDPRVRIVSLDVSRKLDVIEAFFKLKNIIREFKPDVVHSHMVHANILSRLVRLVVRIPRLISTAHSSNEGGRLHMLAYRLTDSLSDISTNVSVDAVRTFEKNKAVKLGRMISVHNGISTDYFHFNASARSRIRDELGVNAKRRLILAVGRLHDAKDYPNLLQALVLLRATVSTYKMFIVGDGPLRSKLESMVSLLKLSNQVKFLGVRHDVADLMSAADVFVLPSAWEGFGLVVAEAMACERVVVATDCGGVREVLGDTGYLVQSRNSPALAAALEKALFLSIDEASAMGHAARQRVIERYSLNGVVEKWCQIYSANINGS